MRTLAYDLLKQEAIALQMRLARVKPFVMTQSMAPAASIHIAAQRAVDQFLLSGRRELKKHIRQYLNWLHTAIRDNVSVYTAQRRFTHLRLRFNAVLTQLDIYADALIQRSEHQTGVWLAGLDSLADAALQVSGNLFKPPSIICYLDRGAGAAIRRVRTRLPGGGSNPVAIIRIPRERMIGSGIASSLIHEVGHQGIALLGLINSLRPELQNLQKVNSDHKLAWQLWERWLSEILADFWSVSHIGVGSTLGLMGVVSLPKAFVHRINMNDPHPFPWIRVMLSCAIGNTLYPDPQWAALERVWLQMYPVNSHDDKSKGILRILMDTRVTLASMIKMHRSRSLRGRTLSERLNITDRTPDRLRSIWDRVMVNSSLVNELPPVLAFAVIGQAKMDRRISANDEDKMIEVLLRKWAFERAIDVSKACTGIVTAGEIRV